MKKEFINNLILTITFVVIFVVAVYFLFTYGLGSEDTVIVNNQDTIEENSLEENNNLIEDNLEENNMDTTKQVIIETLIEGQGEESKKGDTLVVHYTGTFENGEKFDSSLDRGESFSFILGQGMVIEGWEQGMLGMKAGEKRKIFIPYELGYGEFDYGPIPGKSNLIFEVELLEIK
jgi:peptidylprolyl isomerase/FKBP-type peptidyl-prolyl cis-trans isomerase FkpA